MLRKRDAMADPRGIEEEAAILVSCRVIAKTAEVVKFVHTGSHHFQRRYTATNSLLISHLLPAFFLTIDLVNSLGVGDAARCQSEIS